MKNPKNRVAALMLVVIATCGGVSSAHAMTPEAVQAAIAATDFSRWDGVPTEVLAARRCVNEGTWNEADCVNVLTIAMNNASGDNIDIRTWLIINHGNRSLHPERHIPVVDERGVAHARLRIPRRHGDPLVDTRPWIGDLSADLHEPAMWDYHQRADWEGSYRRRWERTLELATRVIAREIRSHCGAQIWGGPHLDAQALADAANRGYVPVTCTWNGVAPENTYMRFVGRPAAPTVQYGRLQPPQ